MLGNRQPTTLAFKRILAAFRKANEREKLEVRTEKSSPSHFTHPPSGIRNQELAIRNRAKHGQ
jgi:hypothetical protein